VTNSVDRHPFLSAEVNIELKDLSETRKSLVVTLDQSEVDTEHKAVVREMAKFARLPGFRPGHAPADLVVKRFAKEVRDELKSKVVGKAYRGGIEKTKLEVVNVVQVD
jgi:trigger factor